MLKLGNSWSGMLTIGRVIRQSRWLTMADPSLTKTLFSAKMIERTFVYSTGIETATIR